MAVRLYSPDGQPIDVPDDQVASALSSGKLGMSGPINVVGPTGDTYRATTADEYLHAAKAGFRIETGDEAQHRGAVQKYGGNNVEAFLAGASRGASLGLSDLFATEAGIVSKEELKGLIEANPTITMGSEILGSFAPGAAIGKGLSIAAKAFRLAPELIQGVNAAEQATSHFGLLTAFAPEGTLLRTLAKGGDKALAYAATGAVEGGAIGLQQGITEQALGDPQAAAEGILAHVGEGALQGMLFGGALGAAALGAGAVGSRLRRLTEKVEEALQPALEKKRIADTFADLGIDAGSLRKLREDKGEGWFKEVTKVLRQDAPDGQPFSGATRQENVDRLRETINYYGRHIDGAVEQLSGEAQAARGKALGREIATERAQGPMVQFTEQPGAPGGIGISGPEERAAQTMAGKEPIQIDSKDLVRKVRGLSESLSQAPGDTAAAGTIEKEAKALEDTFKGGEMSLSEAQKWRQSYRRAWEGAPEAGTSRWAQRQVERTIQEEITTKALEIAKETKNVPLYKELIKSRKAYATLADVGEAAKVFDAPTGFGGKAFGEFAKSFGLRSLVFGQSPLSAAIGAAGYTAVRAGKDIIAPLAKKIGALRNLQEVNEKTTGRLDQAVSSFMRMATGEGAKGSASLASVNVISRLTGSKDKEQSTKKLIEALRVAGSSPDMLADRIAMNLVGVEEHAPIVAAQMAQRMVQGIKILQTLVPPNPISIQPQLHKYAEGDMRRVEEAASALIDPIGVIEEMAKGVPPSPAQMVILRTVYERVWSLTTAQIAERLAGEEKPVSYDTVRLLSSFTGQPLDWSMQGDAIARSQALYQPPQTGAGSRGGGLQALQGATQNFQSEPTRLSMNQLGGR